MAVEIIINVESFDQDKDRNESLKIMYRDVLLGLYNQIGTNIDLSLLSRVIVSEYYKEDLFQLQRANGHNEFITENDYARGIAQVVSSVENGKKSFIIIIDKDPIVSIIPDSFLETMKTNLNDDEQYQNLLLARQLAINIFYHECGHVYEYSLRTKIDWFSNKKYGTGLITIHTVSNKYMARIFCLSYSLTLVYCKYGRFSRTVFNM